MITAKEARELAGPTVEEIVADTFAAIKNAAVDKKRSLSLHTDFWVYGGYSKNSQWLEAKKLLEDQGFVVEFYYKEMQFVDMYTIVRW